MVRQSMRTVQRLSSDRWEVWAIIKELWSCLENLDSSPTIPCPAEEPQTKRPGATLRGTGPVVCSWTSGRMVGIDAICVSRTAAILALICIRDHATSISQLNSKISCLPAPACNQHKCLTDSHPPSWHWCKAEHLELSLDFLSVFLFPHYGPCSHKSCTTSSIVSTAQGLWEVVFLM